jgi:glucosylglycerate synthase
MAKVELSEDPKTGMEATGTTDLLVGVAVPIDAEQLRATATRAIQSMGDHFPGLRTVVAFPGVGPVDEAKDEAPGEASETSNQLRFLPYTPPPGSAGRIPSLTPASTYQALFAMARELGVSACAVIGYDLAALQSNFLAPVLAPVLDNRCELAMPVYAMGKFDGLLNSSILYPLTRALYGRRVRFPLASDFCVSARMIPELEIALQRSVSQGQTLFWPATEAALRDRSVCQVYVDTHHVPAADGVDLSTILAQTAGPLFMDVATNAALWQRIRGSQPGDISGVPTPSPADNAHADSTPMIETFQLGFRNLQEVWSLVLPPVTLLELKRLSRASADRFHLPDELWARVVYDFALAHRLRALSRSHLLGALTPIYLAWVASYALEVSNANPAEAEQRIEKLARAFEEAKPYLLSRWRWPDRFNP